VFCYHTAGLCITGKIVLFLNFPLLAACVIYQVVHVPCLKYKYRFLVDIIFKYLKLTLENETLKQKWCKSNYAVNRLHCFCAFTLIARRYRIEIETHHCNMGRVLAKASKRAFAFAGPTAWNSLPDIIRSAESINTFKRLLKSWLSCKKTALKLCTSTETLWNRKAPSLSSPDDEEIFLHKLPKSWHADVYYYYYYYYYTTVLFSNTAREHSWCEPSLRMNAGPDDPLRIVQYGTAY